MSVTSKISLSTIKLDDLREQIDANRHAYVKVGILGKNAARPGSPINNPTIGIIHEKGSMTAKPPIPRRSFLEDPLVEHLPERIAELGPDLWKEAILSKGLISSLDLIGVVGENIVQTAFDTGGDGKWAPNSPRTIARKGSSAILIDTQEMRKAISSEVVNEK